MHWVRVLPWRKWPRFSPPRIIPAPPLFNPVIQRGWVIHRSHFSSKQGVPFGNFDYHWVGMFTLLAIFWSLDELDTQVNTTNILLVPRAVGHLLLCSPCGESRGYASSTKGVWSGKPPLFDDSMHFATFNKTTAKMLRGRRDNFSRGIEGFPTYRGRYRKVCECLRALLPPI